MEDEQHGGVGHAARATALLPLRMSGVMHASDDGPVALVGGVPGRVLVRRAGRGMVRLVVPPVNSMAQQQGRREEERRGGVPPGPGRKPLPRVSHPSPKGMSPVPAARRAQALEGRRSRRRRNWALRATTIVERLISTAPTAGESSTPTGASTPAASGTVTAL